MSPAWQLFSGLLGGRQSGILFVQCIWTKFDNYFPQKQTLLVYFFPPSSAVFCSVCCCCCYFFVGLFRFGFFFFSTACLLLIALKPLQKPSVFISASISVPWNRSLLRGSACLGMACASSGLKSAVEALQRAWNPRGTYCCHDLGDFSESRASAEPRWMCLAFRMGVRVLPHRHCHQSASLGAWQHLSSEHHQWAAGRGWPLQRGVPQTWWDSPFPLGAPVLLYRCHSSVLLHVLLQTHLERHARLLMLTVPWHGLLFPGIRGGV